MAPSTQPGSSPTPAVDPTLPRSQPTAAGEVIIEVQHLDKAFSTPEGKRAPVLQDINLTVHQGEIVVLLGQSGCGKSTLLRCVAGLIAPDRGEVRYRGEAINGTNPGVSMVFQNFALLPWLNVRANIEVALEARGVRSVQRDEMTEQAIERVGLKGFESAYPRELSGGMCQRVDFARALVVRPDVLLMDEPFSALDVLTAANLRRDLIELWSSEDFPTKAILMVTHNMEEAVEMADRIVLLSPGAGKQHPPVTNELPRPRDRNSSPFRSFVDFLYGEMTGRPKSEASGRAATQPEEASPVELPLPRVTPDGIGGLLRILDARGRVDLPMLATRLNLEIDELLPLINAAAMLGFAEVEDADIELTPTGKQLVTSERREARKIFAEQARRRAPLVRTIVCALSEAPDGTLNKRFFLDLLEHDFTEENARVQLDTAIEWGRYGELFRYHATTGQIGLVPRRATRSPGVAEHERPAGRQDGAVERGTNGQDSESNQNSAPS